MDSAPNLKLPNVESMACTVQRAPGSSTKGAGSSNRRLMHHYEQEPRTTTSSAGSYVSISKRKGPRLLSRRRRRGRPERVRRAVMTRSAVMLILKTKPRASNRVDTDEMSRSVTWPRLHAMLSRHTPPLSYNHLLVILQLSSQRRAESLTSTTGQ